MLWLLTLSVGALDCNPTYCPPNWLSDAYCDSDTDSDSDRDSCNIIPCKFDSQTELTSPYYLSFVNSDCLYDCLKDCSMEELENDVCDEACNTKECGYDLGVCGYCAKGCMESMLGDGTCNEECNTPMCYSDDGDCLCDTGCTKDKLDNDVCDSECNTLNCSYDHRKCTCNFECPTEWLQDGWCDPKCNTYDCQFDKLDCDCGNGCTYDLWTNNVCDSECNYAECAFDDYKCTCAVGCTKEMLRNSVCDEACNSYDCDYDSKLCNCSADCNWDDIGDRICDDACDTKNCYFDNGDCSCAPGCIVSMLGDGTCNTECYTKECDYDKPDCGSKYCSPGCSPDYLENDTCEYECNFEACNYDKKCLCSELCKNCSYDNGNCGYCALGCSYSLYGDGECTPACNVKACSYDFTDCCNGDCPVSGEECALNCLFSECLYDRTCTDDFLKDAAKYSQLLAQNFNKQLNLDECYIKEPDCTEAKLRSYYAGTGDTSLDDCSSDQCFGQFGQDQYCSTNLHCDKCIGSKCLKCKSGYLHYYTKCVKECPSGYRVHSKIANLCYPLSDLTLETSQTTLYVSTSETGDNIFSSLMEAMASVHTEYTAIYLTEETTDLSPLTDDAVAKYKTLGNYSPFKRLVNTNLIQVKISTKICTSGESYFCIDSPGKIIIRDPQISLEIDLELVFINVVIDGLQTFFDNCTGGFCSYCPYLKEVKNASYVFDDKYKYYDKKPIVGCNSGIETKSFIDVSCKGKLRMEATTIQNNRQGYYAFIEAKGTVDLFKVDFNNILATDKVLTGFINQDCSFCASQSINNYECKFSHEEGSVKYLNNGYEFTSTISQSGFYYGVSVQDVAVRQVEFSSNIALRGKESATSAVQHLFTFKNAVKPILFEKCNFIKNYIYGSIINVDDKSLVFSNPEQKDGKLLETTWEHIKITSSKFEKNTVDSLLTVVMGPMVNVVLSKSTITNNIFFSSMVDITHDTAVTAIDSDGASGIYKVDKEKMLLTSLPRRVTFSALKISSTYWKQYSFYLKNMANVKFDKSSMTNVGAYSGNVADFTLKPLIEDSAIYMKAKFIEDSRTALCERNILLDTCTNVQISRFNFSSVTCQGAAGAYALSHSGAFNLTKVVADHIISNATEGALFDIRSVSKAKVQGEDVKVSNLVNEVGAGAFYLKEAKLKLNKFTISKCSTALSTGLFLVSLRSAEINNSSFTDLTTSGFGAGFQVDFSAKEQPTLKVTNSKFTACTSKAFSGGAIFMVFSVKPLDLLIDNCEFKRNKSHNGGSAVFVDSTVIFKDSSTISNCKFTENSNDFFGVLSINLSTQITISDCSFYSNTVNEGVVYLGLTQKTSFLKMRSTQVTNNKSNIGINVVGIGKDSNISFESVTVQNNQISASVSLWRVTVSVKNSNFSDNSGSLVCDYCYATVTDTKFLRNINPEPAGAVSLLDESTFSCTRCEFTQNQASSGGAIRVDNKSTLSVKDSSFTGNSASESGGVIYMINSYKDNSIINSTITGNSVTGSGMIIMIESKLSLDKVTFSANKSTKDSPGIITLTSEISANESTFSFQEAQQNAFFQVSAGSKASFTNSKFSSGKATLSGGLGSILNSSGSFKDCSFTDINSGPGSGIISSESAISFEGLTASKLQSNDQAALLEIKTGSLSMLNSVVRDFNSTAIITDSTKTISISGSTFERGRALSMTVANIMNFESFIIERSTFRGNSAVQDNAGISAVNLITWNLNGTLNISESSFTDNQAASQGVLYTDTKFVNITHSSFFNNSATQGRGGAFELGCEEASPCYMSVSHSNFANNSAALDGGAIYWSKQEPQLVNLTFSHNSAPYGNDVASFGVNLKSLDYNETTQRLSKVADGMYLNIASGQHIPTNFTIALVDSLGQVIGTDYTSIGTISPVDTQNVTVTGTSRVQAYAGVYYFSDVKINAEPGVEIKVSVTSDALSDLANDATGKGSVEDIALEVKMRECEAGEAQVGKECVKCGYDTYSLKPTQQCTSCPSGAICYGGALMVPQSGYWRSDKYTDLFFACSNSAACLGSPYITPSLTGICSYGFRGNRCQACDNGFSRTGVDQCGRCPDNVTNGLKLLGICILRALVIGIMVRSSLANAYQPDQLYSIYIKILTNYLQLVTLTTQLNIAWPSFVLSLFSTQNNAIAVTDQMYFVDCMLADVSEDSYKQVYFNKLIVMAFMPVILGLFAFLYWCLHYLVKQEKAVFKKELIATLVVLFFLIHPDIVKANFAMFSCVELMPGELWLNDNNDIRCYGSEHSFYAVVLALPVLALWGIGVPTFILYYLIRTEQVKLDSLDMKLKFGFIYSGYKKSRFYWEFVILYRKIIIICCVVFFGNYSVKVQALTIMAILAYFVVLQHFIQPYSHHSLNKMEMRGILCAAVTIYCGLYYLTDDLDEPAKIFLFIAMLFANILFFYYFLSKFVTEIAPMILKFLPFLKRVIKLPAGNDFPESDSRGPNYSAKTFIFDTDKVSSLALKLPSATNSELDVNDLFELYIGITSYSQKNTSESDSFCSFSK
jgi:predicted outer membrane repeat protein